MKVSKSVEIALKAALSARKNAHAPYSRFKVGAALQLRGEKEPITGCNVENASFGGTICAERTAIFKAVADHGKLKPEFLVVATNEKNATVPCALCLQVIAEFAKDDLPIYLGNEAGVQKSYKLSDLLPYPFRAFEVK